MLLLEELVNQMGVTGIFKLSFIIDNVLCIGDFRNGQNDNLVTEKLVDDFIQFMNAYERYFEGLQSHLEEKKRIRVKNLELVSLI